MWADEDKLVPATFCFESRSNVEMTVWEHLYDLHPDFARGQCFAGAGCFSF